MSYEEIDKISTNATDVFTGGAEGRYSKPKPTTSNSELKEKKKKAPVAEGTTVEEKVKIKKQVDSTNPIESVETKKERKKKAPKIEKTDEIYENLAETNETTTERKKKTKAPTVTATSDPSTTDPTMNESGERIKRTKKSRAPKIPDETIEQIPDAVPMETKENIDVEHHYGNLPVIDQNELNRSEYEQIISGAFQSLSSQINFTEFLGDDQWQINNLPKSARTPTKSGIRKILPGQKEARSGGSKPNFTKRILTNFSNLVRDENNLIFGERSNFDVAYDSDDDEIDTDSLHKMAQQLREIEDHDREYNPDSVYIQNGDLKFGVREIDDDGKVKFEKRKPILDRQADQSLRESESGKRKLFGILKIPFTRNKDKTDEQAGDVDEKRQSRKGKKKTAEADTLTNE